MLSPLGVLERFRWTRLPQSERFSRLVHVLSEVWGCRRFDAGVDRPQGRTPRIGTGVADILRKPSGTFHTSLPTTPILYTVIPSTPTIPESIPGAGPLVLRLSKHVLSPVEGCERGGGPHPAVTSRQSPPPPICYVIPRSREGSQAPVSRHGIHRRSSPSNFRECKGYSLPFLKQSKPCLKPQNNQNPPPPPRHSRLRSGIHPSGVRWGGGNPSPLGRTYQKCTAFLICQLFLWGWGRGLPCATRNPRKNPLGVVQSNQLRVQSMFNQRSIKTSTPTAEEIPWTANPTDQYIC